MFALMKYKMRYWMLACLLAFSVPVATPEARAQTSEKRPILVFAAASLKNALDAVAAAWEAETGGDVVISYAASSALARQIEQGAPADLFLSADHDWMEWLAEHKLIAPQTRRNLLGNTLVLIAPADSAVTHKIAPGGDLSGMLGDGRLATANVEAVPAGKYAKAALEKLGLWAGIADRIAQSENVRVALAFVARGEAVLGIVYATDARAEPKVKILDVFPTGTHGPIVYPVALTAASQHPAARAFLAFLSTPKAAKLFEQHGFAVLGN